MVVEVVEKVSRSVVAWHALAEKRILSILKAYRVSYSKHLEIKISEAGPSNQRIEPAIVNTVLRRLKKNKTIPVVHKDASCEFVGAPDFGRPGDKSVLQKFKRIHSLFVDCSQQKELCGYSLENLLYCSMLASEKYMVLGSGPLYNPKSKQLEKPPGSEILHFQGKQMYGAEHGAGFDLFGIHKETLTPIGIEAKNIREWIYPHSIEVWRLIARACSFECLPVLAARKISYISRAGFFRFVGILGFETQFQYFHPNVRAYSKYKFSDVISKDGLGFADIKVEDTPRPFFDTFFSRNLNKNAPVYYQRFLKNKDLLAEYAIDKKMASHDFHNTGKRIALYQEFKQKAGFEDPEFPLPPDTKTQESADLEPDLVEGDNE